MCEIFVLIITKLFLFSILTTAALLFYLVALLFFLVDTLLHLSEHVRKHIHKYIHAVYCIVVQSVNTSLYTHMHTFGVPFLGVECKFYCDWLWPMVMMHDRHVVWLHCDIRAGACGAPAARVSG